MPPAPSAPGRPGAPNPGRQRGGLSLRTRLVAVLLAVTLLPLLATAVGGVQLARASLQHQGEQVLLSRARATSTKIDTYMSGVRTSLVSSRQQLAELAAADPQFGPDTLAAMEAILHSDSIARGQQPTSATEYIGLDGRIIASDQAGEEGQDLSGSPRVRAALAATLTTSCASQPAACAIVSGVAFDPSAPTDLRATLEVTAPVYAPGAGPGAHPIAVVRGRFATEQIGVWVTDDATGQGDGGLLVERDTGLILAESIQPGDFTFTSLAPLSDTTVQQLVKDQRYTPGPSHRAPATRTIPGLGLTDLQSGAPNIFSAGSYAGTSPTGMRYVRVALTQGPTDTPWVYLLGRPEAALTAPADQVLVQATSLSRPSLVQIALIAAVITLALSIAAGLFAARWTTAWLVSSVDQLGAIAAACLAVSNDQRRAAEEQRHRLATARTTLHDLHRMGKELSEAIEHGIGFAEDGQRGYASRLAMQQISPGASPDQARRQWWAQWAQAVRERLDQQMNICVRLAREVRVTAVGAGRMRERNRAIATQAASIENALQRGGAVLAMAGGDAPSQPGQPAALQGRGRAANLDTGTLRLVLAGLLIAGGLLPSLVFAAATTTLLRNNLTDQSGQALLAQARSHASALDALLGQQEQSLAALERTYLALVTPGLGVTPELVDQGLAATAPDPTTELLELARSPSGQVVAASTHEAVGASVATLPVFQRASQFQTSISPVYFDPSTSRGWYYIAAPITSADQSRVIGVAIARFSLAPFWQLVAQGSSQSSAEGGSFTLVVERADDIVMADSRHPAGVFAASTTLAPAALNRLWLDGRYPNGLRPPSSPLPAVAAAMAGAATGSGGALGGEPHGFSGAGDTGGPRNQYWLIPLANAPWDLVEAQPLPFATSVADQLTGLDLAFSLAVTVLTAALAVILGQSIIASVRRRRARYRQVARRLATITRQLDEAAQRQEAALPPIESTAQLLGQETTQVGQLLFVQQMPAPYPQQSAPNAYGSYQAWGPSPETFSPLDGLNPDEPSQEGLRRARALANDWNLRQQRILADLASVLNATDELSRASLEGQREAAELESVTVSLLASAR